MVCVSQDTSVNSPSQFWIIISSSLFLLLNILIVQKAKSLLWWPQFLYHLQQAEGKQFYTYVLGVAFGWVSCIRHISDFYSNLQWRPTLGNECELSWSSGGGTGYPLQYFHLENSMDRGAWQATVHGVAWWNSLGDYWVTKWPYLSKIPTTCQRMPSTSSPWSFSYWVCLYRQIWLYTHSAWMVSIYNTPMFTTSVMLYTIVMQVFTRQYYKG